MPSMQGRASTVTDLGDGTVLRLGGDPEREARIMAHARAHGFPVPAVHEVRRDGMVLEHIGGGTTVIDWTNAHGGSPDADLAMTWLIAATSAGLPGRIAAWLFVSHVGREPIRRGLGEAARFRLADPNVTPPRRIGCCASCPDPSWVTLVDKAPRPRVETGADWWVTLRGLRPVAVRHATPSEEAPYGSRRDGTEASRPLHVRRP